jgi:hypothetical protein
MALSAATPMMLKMLSLVATIIVRRALAGSNADYVFTALRKVISAWLSRGWISSARCVGTMPRP